LTVQFKYKFIPLKLLKTTYALVPMDGVPCTLK